MEAQMAKAVENTAQKAREQAEAAVKGLQAEIEAVRVDIRATAQAVEAARVRSNALADQQEDALAHGDAAKDSELRREVALAADEVNVGTAKVRGLHRRLDELEPQLRPLVIEALRAWIPEIRAERDAALTALDGRKASTVEVAECEEYVTCARAFLGLCHDCENLGIPGVPRPGWDARFQLEERGLPPAEFAPRAVEQIQAPFGEPRRPMSRQVRAQGTLRVTPSGVGLRLVPLHSPPKRDVE